MSLARDMDLLRKVPLLADFPDEQLRLLAFSAENVSYRDGEVLFVEGERADGGLVVASGAVMLESENEANGQGDRYGPGSLIGETALLVETRRPARAVASGATDVIRIRRALFKRMLQEFPDIAQRLFDSRAARFRDTAAALGRVGTLLEQLEREHSAFRAARAKASGDAE
ncbi:cyclic nucleotide-binding domain-containing protein [Stappia taiwanensis]|uniref:Cyclic nucleotide-binding domain-containing protein n=1 Tax=Stappia taiwanensis TaxID=992267 RepID=A0A838XJK2_9HYPH|nr:cyclic nucleotide-binding domain-containing protein [Stappia taiwanensis]MBA4611509.1 cyclic nucleotide-binding domain-containing protein [Stappia taiwanensis]